MNRYYILIFFFILFSCNKKNKLEKIFIAAKDEYWQYENTCGSHGVNFRFNEDGTYDKYNRFIDRGFVLFNNDGDIVNDKRSWSLINDSIFKWDELNYKIVLLSDKKIVLSYVNKEDVICKVLLLKVSDKKSNKKEK